MPCRSGPHKSARLRQGLIGALALAAIAVAAPPALAGFADGVKSYEAGDYKGAFDAWLPLAEGGDLAAMRNIGHLYRWGQGVDRDIDKAIAWYRRAADAGFARAQANLAAIYLQGDGVPVDYAEARKWFEAAAHQGNAVAQYNMGLIYELGLGVEPSEPTALGWYNLAAKQGQTDALNRLSLLVMTPDKAQKDAVLPRGPDEAATATPNAAAASAMPAPPGAATVAPAAAMPATDDSARLRSAHSEDTGTDAATTAAPVAAPPATPAAPPAPAVAAGPDEKPAGKPAEDSAAAPAPKPAPKPASEPAPAAGDERGLLGRFYSAIVSGGGVSLPDLVGATPDKDGGNPPGNPAADRQ